MGQEYSLNYITLIEESLIQGCYLVFDILGWHELSTRGWLIRRGILQSHLHACLVALMALDFASFAAEAACSDLLGLLSSILYTLDMLISTPDERFSDLTTAFEHQPPTSVDTPRHPRDLIPADGMR